MERLTFEGNFCDIAMCDAEPEICGGSCSQREIWERLKQYEDLEAEGRLVVLPCKIGDRLFNVTRRSNCQRPPVTVTTLNKNNFWRVVVDGEFGKTVFATLDEAFDESFRLYKEENK